MPGRALLLSRGSGLQSIRTVHCRCRDAHSPPATPSYCRAVHMSRAHGKWVSQTTSLASRRVKSYLRGRDGREAATPSNSTQRARRSSPTGGPLTQLALGLSGSGSLMDGVHVAHTWPRAAAMLRARSTNPSGTRPESLEAVVAADTSERVSQYSSQASLPTSAQ